MLLYHCPDCGAWQDVRLAEAFTNILNEAAAALAQRPPISTPGYPCPYGHGFMIQVQPIDRIFVRPGVIEAATDQALVNYGPIMASGD